MARGEAWGCVAECRSGERVEGLEAVAGTGGGLEGVEVSCGLLAEELGVPGHALAAITFLPCAISTLTQ